MVLKSKAPGGSLPCWCNTTRNHCAEDTDAGAGCVKGDHQRFPRNCRWKTTSPSTTTIRLTHFHQLGNQHLNTHAWHSWRQVIFKNSFHIPTVKGSSWMGGYSYGSDCCLRVFLRRTILLRIMMRTSFGSFHVLHSQTTDAGGLFYKSKADIFILNHQGTIS